MVFIPPFTLQDFSHIHSTDKVGNSHINTVLPRRVLNSILFSGSSSFLNRNRNQKY